jgi:hypothetical protein
MDEDEDPPSIRRLTRDLAKAASTLSEQEARFLVDAYYIAQEDRKRSANQMLAMGDEPHEVIGWFKEQSETIEHQIKRALQSYSQAHPVGTWMHSVHGIGPVIAAGMLAHIDIKKAPTAGHIWRYAGLDPTVKWEKSTKRPWNAQLKTLCWKVGQSFMKFSGHEDCVYGHVYRTRKEMEVKRNDSDGNAQRASLILTEKRWDRNTEAYKALSAGKLPAAQIDAMARRYAVKLFLSHLQTIWWFVDTGVLPVKPYAIGQMNHTHFIQPPNTDIVGGLTEALRNYR